VTGNRLAQLIARGLMTLGLGVGALAVCIWVFDIRIDIPAWMWRVAIAKLTLAGALGLLVTGATLLRYLRHVSQRDANTPLPMPGESTRLPGVMPNWIATHSEREKTPVSKTDSARRTP
jgi:hypothetical protein